MLETRRRSEAATFVEIKRSRQDANSDYAPPEGSKKVVFRFRSVKSIVIAPTSTGSDVDNNTAVIKIDQTRGALSIEIIL